MGQGWRCAATALLLASAVAACGSSDDDTDRPPASGTPGDELAGVQVGDDGSSGSPTDPCSDLSRAAWTDLDAILPGGAQSARELLAEVEGDYGGSFVTHDGRSVSSHVTLTHVDGPVELESSSNAGCPRVLVATLVADVAIDSVLTGSLAMEYRLDEAPHEGHGDAPLGDFEIDAEFPELRDGTAVQPDHELRVFFDSTGGGAVWVRAPDDGSPGVLNRSARWGMFMSL